MSEFDTELNCEGLNCPLPILKTKKTIDGMSSGQLLKMTATDPGSVTTWIPGQNVPGIIWFPMLKTAAYIHFLLRRSNFF